MDPSALPEEKEAMLQNTAPTCPSIPNGSSQLSSPSSAQDICRICHCEAESNAPLIAPCLCSGSLRYVHQECLQQWIKSSDTKKCELCKFEFIMQTKIKPFRNWEKLEMSAVERRKVFCSVTFHVVAITCVVWSLYVLIDRTAEEVKAGQLEWPFWTKLIVVAIGFTGGLVFMYVQCKMYMQLCRRWKAFNRIIYVQNAPPKAIIVNMNSSSPIQNSCLESSLPMTSAKVETCTITSSIVETHTLSTVAPAIASTPKLTFPLSSLPPSSPIALSAPSQTSSSENPTFDSSNVFSSNINNNNYNISNNNHSDTNTRISEDMTESDLNINNDLQVVQRIT